MFGTSLKSIHHSWSSFSNRMIPNEQTSTNTNSVTLSICCESSDSSGIGLTLDVGRKGEMKREFRTEKNNNNNNTKQSRMNKTHDQQQQQHVEIFENEMRVKFKMCEEYRLRTIHFEWFVCFILENENEESRKKGEKKIICGFRALH